MIVCICRRISDSAIRAALEAGARTPGEIAAATGATADCGCCASEIEALAHAQGGPCSTPPCAGCPNAPPASEAA